MGKCPSCNADIDSAFGILNCPNCQALLVIDLDGNASLAETSADPTLDPASQLRSFSESPGVQASQDFSVVHRANETKVSLNHQYAASAKDPAENAADFEVEAKSDNFDDLVPSQMIPSPMKPGPVIQDIADFANSTDSDSREGSFYVTLRLSGIDSPEIRASVAAALNDRKMNWDSDEIIRLVKLGQLVLPKLNPVKASVLINRLKALPIQLSWEQHAVSDNPS
jgi:hypothetical protein